MIKFFVRPLLSNPIFFVILQVLFVTFGHSEQNSSSLVNKQVGGGRVNGKCKCGGRFGDLHVVPVMTCVWPGHTRKSGE